MMRKVIVGPMDEPITLRDGETLEDTHVRQLGSWYGRVLFAYCGDPLVHMVGRGVTVRHCIVQCQNMGIGMKVSHR